tara:strand:- start:168 stop:371 length:204 start_codon:yes stop_codon:yes gene_type:complete
VEEPKRFDGLGARSEQAVVVDLRRATQSQLEQAVQRRLRRRWRRCWLLLLLRRRRSEQVRVVCPANL